MWHTDEIQQALRLARNIISTALCEKLMQYCDTKKLFMWAQSVFICGAASRSVIKCTMPIFHGDAVNTPRGGSREQPPRGRACRRRWTSDCPRHVEYACGFDCCEKMDMNNKDATIIQGHSIPTTLFPHLQRMHEYNLRENKNQHNSKSNGGAYILHFKSTLACLTMSRTDTVFKPLLCLDEYQTKYIIH